MSRPDKDRLADIDFDDIKHETDKAILFVIDGKDVRPQESRRMNSLELQRRLRDSHLSEQAQYIIAFLYE